MNKQTQKKVIGGEFIIKNPDSDSVFIPEEFSEEQKMIASMAHDFLKTEVEPNYDRIEKQEEGLMSVLLEKAGDQGLLSISLPEEYGGYEKDFVTSMLVTETLGGGHSFSVSIAAHTGIGTLPIYYFGTEDQKMKYLPKLASGEWKGSYCLTEPGSGSDALAAKTVAVLSPDGNNYVLNGQKMWITNAGFAQVFIVFAQLDGNLFTAFIVDRDSPGLSFGEEEHKMGIKGSSTRQVFFTNCSIPKENLLGQPGRGHIIAFNILNIGRAKLAAATLGGCKETIAESTIFATQREQFGKPIAEFGAIKFKIAEQARKIFALESAVYRVSKLIDDQIDLLQAEGANRSDALLGAAEEFAIECAILKISGSESLDFVVDEGVQIFGGMGYSADAPMERAYRDSRINRIFEGTNEINRLLMIDMLLKRALKGKIDLMTPAKAVQKELLEIPDMSSVQGDDFYHETVSVSNMKKSVLLIAGAAANQFMEALEEEQEIIMNIADMIIETFMAESVLLRVKKLSVSRPRNEIAIQHEILRIQVNTALKNILLSGQEAAMSFSSGDELKMLLLGLKRFSKYETFNIKDSRRTIAGKVIAEGKYCF